MKKKTVALLLASIFVLGLTAGGTLAWLTDTTEAVTNVFTTGRLDIELTEETGETYKMVPGHVLGKDPKVTVKAESEKCYVFVKIDVTDNFGDFLSYDGVEDGWTELKDVEGVTGVYYRIVDEKDTDQPFYVIKGNKVTVKADVTKKQMDDLKEENLPKLTVTAYGTQYFKNNTDPFTPEDAWKNVSSLE